MESIIYEDLRPYCDDDIPSAMKRIATNDYFPHLAAYLFPNEEEGAVRLKMESITTVAQFQSQIMYPATVSIIQKSINRLSFDGLEHIDPTKGHLFVANHRDIVMDSMLLCYIFHNHHIETPQITFGSNLMRVELVIDIGKSNKMFKVKRGGTPKEFYINSLHLSQYIRDAIVVKNSSIWIAQRNGRTKDGIDKTEPGLLRMFSMSGEKKEMVSNLSQLNIVPVSISYQFETCDLLKARELYLSQNTKYIKAPAEDLHSILTGINQYKGNVHLSICPPITPDDLSGLNVPPSEMITAVADLIDQRIQTHYRLWNTNWIARSLIEGTLYADKFTEKEYDYFIDRMEEKLAPFGDLATHLKRIFLDIYANPTKILKT